ncbi:MAG: hypothetical protein OXN18_01690 [Gemmatimonadota bacterium]|nr:hypothetical protein [Gemmatimonadota bacterium]
MIVLFTGGAALTLAYALPPVLTAACVCLVITATLYRFLGGVEGSRFAVASFRAGGSVAVFAAAMWFVNGELVARNPAIQPGPEDWVAIGRDGVPVDLRIGGQSLNPDASEFLRSTSWGIRNDSNAVRVQAGAHDLALIGLPSFGSLGLFDHIEMVEGRGLRYTDDLTEGMEASLSPPYPFRIRADGFGDSYNGFSILDAEDGAVMIGGSLLSKSFLFFEHEGSHFMVFVSRAVHNDLDRDPFAAFGFAQVRLSFRGSAP